VRYERLVIEAGEDAYAVDLHPRLTVFAGLGSIERDGLVSELIGALSSTRSGVHAEMATDAGARFAVFRPIGARHRVVEIDTATDVSDRYRDGEGRVDLLAPTGLDARAARRRLRVSRTDLLTSARTDSVTRRLARVDPASLWSTAERLRITESHLQVEADASGTQPEDIAVMQRIEEHHQASLTAHARHEQYRKLSFAAAAVAAILAVPLSIVAGAASAAPLIVVAAAIAAMSFMEFKRMQRAEDAEKQALGAMGVDSYFGFQLQRVNEMVASDKSRKRLIAAAEEHRASVAAWQAIAGEVDVVWALEHRAEIDAEHIRWRRDRTGPAQHDDDERDDLARALLDRLGEARTLAAGGETMPLILDDPLLGVPPEHKPDMLELLLEASLGQQLIYLTEDPDVSAWARVEALTGDIGVLEPAGAGDPAVGRASA
jgi:hypothetical protein